MIGQHKRTLEHCVSFQPVKCLKQSEALSVKELQHQLQQQQQQQQQQPEQFDDEHKAQDEVVDATVENAPHQQPYFPEELHSSALDKEARDNNSSSQSQDHSSIELGCALQESSASSPAPTRLFHLQIKRVPLGPDHQVEVPDWDPSRKNNRAEESVWYGELVWPRQEDAEADMECRRAVGNGRPAGPCRCPHAGSVDCVRYHVDQERRRLMDELGRAFDLWGFHDMGECVAQQWTQEEERTFREIVRLHPASIGENFWSRLVDSFPGRSFMELVSYYFNVFVLRRRAVQNRVDPLNPDSDDDEADLDSDGEWQSDDELEVEEDDIDEERIEQLKQRRVASSSYCAVAAAAPDELDLEQLEEEYNDEEEEDDDSGLTTARPAVGEEDEDGKQQQQLQQQQQQEEGSELEKHKQQHLAFEELQRWRESEMEILSRTLPDSWLEWDSRLHLTSPQQHHHHQHHHHHHQQQPLQLQLQLQHNQQQQHGRQRLHGLELASTKGAMKELFGDEEGGGDAECRTAGSRCPLP